MIDRHDPSTWGGVIIFDGILMLIAVIVAIDERQTLALLVGAILSVSIWLGYLKN
jgi:hypothetical protein